MNKDDVLKFIDGKTYYYTDYIYFLYEELRKRDEIIKEVREYIENKEINTLHFNSKDFLDTSIATELLEILDKVEE